MTTIVVKYHQPIFPSFPLLLPSAMIVYTVLLWLLFISLASLLLLLPKRRQKREERILPPGPKKVPIIGNLHQLGSVPHRSLWLLSQKYGPLMYMQLGLRPTLVVSSAEMATEILKTHDLDFCTRPRLTSTDKYTYNRCDISMAPYGEYWREMRKICILQLFSAKRVESSRVIREEEVSLMLQSISRSSSKQIDMRKAMVSLANNIMCRVALGRKYQEEGEYETSLQLHRILEEVEALLGGFFVADYFPALGWVDRLTGQEGRLEKNAGELDAFYEEVIKEHLDLARTTPEYEDIVDVLLRVQRDAGHLTKENTKAVLTDNFIAGSETTSATLVWAMAELAKNPKAMKKAQEEVRVMLGSKGKVEEGDIKQLQYLKSVVKETLRLHPPVPLLLPRETMRHCKIAGYDILPKTLVYVNAWGIGRDPNTWDEAEMFTPERFMNSPIDFKGHDFELIPFGSGRRICPAMNMGIIIIELALANMLYFFDWELPGGMREEDIDMDDSPGIIMHKRTPLHLVAVERIIN